MGSEGGGDGGGLSRLVAGGAVAGADGALVISQEGKGGVVLAESRGRRAGGAQAKVAHNPSNGQEDRHAEQDARHEIHAHEEPVVGD